jgi:hypothetical protein
MVVANPRLNTVLGNMYGNNIAINIGKKTNIAINIGGKHKIAVVIGKITVIAIPYNIIGPTSGHSSACFGNASGIADVCRFDWNGANHI